MAVTKRVNWWVIGGLALCLVIWSVGFLTVSKTANLYEHRSNAGFRHDLIEHARGHWLNVKRVVTPGPGDTRS